LTIEARLALACASPRNRLGEAAEHLRQELDPDAGVGNGDLDVQPSRSSRT
jgi:hypothetical protein